MSRDPQIKADFLSYPEFCSRNLGLAAERFDSPALSREVYQNINRIIVTGNGDSYAAALATQDFCGRMFPGIGYHVMRCIDVSRHFIFEDKNPGNTLVIAISASGSGARASEAVLRAQAQGCLTLAITANPQSRLAGHCQYVHLIDPPEKAPFSPATMTKSYFSTALSLLMFGLVSGMQLETVTRDQARETCQDIQHYVNEVYSEEILEALDLQMHSLAQQWQHYLGYGFTGGGSDFALACFGNAKFFELCGSLNSLNDCEDWCHIDYFQTKRPQLGNIAVAMKGCASFGRTMETVVSMSKSQRNVLLITDEVEVPPMEGVWVCTLPQPKAAYSAASAESFPWCCCQLTLLRLASTPILAAWMPATPCSARKAASTPSNPVRLYWWIDRISKLK